MGKKVYFNQIGLKGLNPRMINTLLDEKSSMDRIRACMQCGECSAGCPSGRWTALRTRKIIHSALLGVERVLEDPELWMCTTCFRCLERCPRRVPVTEVIILLRNIAAREGNIQDNMKNTIKGLNATGHAVPLGGEDSVNAKLREWYGLKKIPPTVHSHPEALEEVRKLFKVSGFKDRISLEW